MFVDATDELSASIYRISAVPGTPPSKVIDLGTIWDRHLLNACLKHCHDIILITHN